VSPWCFPLANTPITETRSGTLHVHEIKNEILECAAGSTGPGPPSISGGGDRRRAGAGWGPGGGPGWSSPGGRRSDHCTHVRQGQLVGTRAAGEQRWESRRNRPEGSRTEVSASLAYAIAGSIDPDPTIRAAQRDTHI
jgi:hypothetical protein